MIELLQLNGEARPRTKLLYDFTEVKVAEAKEAWTEAMEGEYELAYPSSEVVVDADGIETTVQLEQAITYDEYMAETVVTQVAVEATETTEAIPEITELVREFKAVEIDETDFDAYMLTKYSEMRQAEYPPMADYLDAIVKGDTVAQGAYVDACNAIKLKYPKA